MSAEPTPSDFQSRAPMALPTGPVNDVGRRDSPRKTPAARERIAVNSRRRLGVLDLYLSLRIARNDIEYVDFG